MCNRRSSCGWEGDFIAGKELQKQEIAKGERYEFEVSTIAPPTLATKN